LDRAGPARLFQIYYLLVFEVLGFNGTGGPCLDGVGVTGCWSIRGETGGPLIGVGKMPVTVVVGLGLKRGLTDVVVVIAVASVELTRTRFGSEVLTMMPSFKGFDVGDTTEFVTGVLGIN
jgi:hypothetical protein